jgi:hypothetical protein
MVSVYAAEGQTSEEVTTETNTTGVHDPVVRITPERGQFLKFLNHGDRGSKPGLPLFMKLRDSNDDPLPLDTEVRLAYLASGSENAEVVTIPLKNIQDYINNTLTEQQNEEQIDQFKHELKQGRSWNVRDIDELQIEILSSTEIDHSNSTFQFENSYVQQGSIDR